MKDNNANNKVYIVTNFHTTSACGCFRGNMEDLDVFRTLGTPTMDIKAVFADKATAEAFIKRQIKDECDVLDSDDAKTRREIIEHIREYHYDIEVFDVQNKRELKLREVNK